MMKNIYFIIVFAFVAFFFSACKKDEVRCLKVKFVMNYCPKPGASLVNIESTTGESKQIALLGIPEAFQIRDKVFYVKYHYDKTLDRLDSVAFCPAIFAPTKIYITDSASDTPCND